MTGTTDRHMQLHKRVSNPSPPQSGIIDMFTTASAQALPEDPAIGGQAEQVNHHSFGTLLPLQLLVLPTAKV
jgi:hypothetical protein